mgnify:CR=1 FL=1
MLKKEDVAKAVTITSGSIETENSEKISDDIKDVPGNGEFNVNDVINQLLNNAWIESELGNIACTPSYMLSAEKSPVYLYSVDLKTFRPVPCPIEVIPMEPAGEGKTYCMIGHGLYIVDDDLIKDVGWN